MGSAAAGAGSGEAVARFTKLAPGILGGEFQAEAIRIGDAQIAAAGEVSVGDAVLLWQILVDVRDLEALNAGGDVIEAGRAFVDRKVTRAKPHIASGRFIVLPDRAAEQPGVKSRGLGAILRDDLYVIERAEMELIGRHGSGSSGSQSARTQNAQRCAPVH